MMATRDLTTVRSGLLLAIHGSLDRTTGGSSGGAAAAILAAGMARLKLA